MPSSTTFWLHAKGPYAAFRLGRYGFYEPTALTISPSSAYGLLLNIAGIDVRASSGKGKVGRLPALEVAIGEVAPGVVGSLLQQLHCYTAGESDEAFRKKSLGGAGKDTGTKIWISPIRRELLCDFEVVLGVRAEEKFLARLREGLSGTLERYGFPFAGDNNCLFESLEELWVPPTIPWWVRVTQARAHPRLARLPVSVDHADSTKTAVGTFLPSPPAALPPRAAWTAIG